VISIDDPIPIEFAETEFRPQPAPENKRNDIKVRLVKRDREMDDLDRQNSISVVSL
jgi:hypothetical protein